jgi:NRAMP (natural resistance-associated macrophage protein)-like metal ion transporter
MARKNKKSSFGPGFLVAAAFIGPGTVTSCSMAGARFGYALIFALVFATVTTIILQQMTGRLSLGSKHDLGQALREFPKSPLTKGIFAILTLSSITFGCAAYEAGNIIGGSLGLEMVTSVSQKYWVAIISLIAIFILSRGKYKLVEKFLIFLVFLMSVSFLTTLVIIKPDLLSIFKGMIPSFPKNSLYIILALVGTTVVPYNLFLHSSAVKEKWKSIAHLKEVKKDLLLSVSLGGIISASIVITSAAAFYGKGISLESGIQLGQQLKPLFGSFTNFLFGLGFFAAGLSSALTAPYAAAFASSGVLGWKGGHNSKGFKGVWLGVILAGLVVSYLRAAFNFNPLSVILFAQVANGFVLPVASIFLLFVLNNRQKMGKLVNNIKQNILGSLIILIVSFLGLWNIIKLFLK